MRNKTETLEEMDKTLRSMEEQLTRYTSFTCYDQKVIKIKNIIQQLRDIRAYTERELSEDGSTLAGRPLKNLSAST